MSSKPNILVVCIHNSARSQMAEEYIRKYAGDIFDVESAGLEPSNLNPNVVKVLKEDGIDISDKKTRSVFDLSEQGRDFSYVITVCSHDAHERCPVFDGTIKRMNWPFDDPSKFEGTEEDILNYTRKIREQIKQKIIDFVKKYKETGSV